MFVLGAFVACGLSGVAFLLAAKRDENAALWLRVGRGSWMTMTAAMAGAAVVLLFLLLTHQFQYAYVYQYTSRALPAHYLFSAFWAGQEGSFILWILYVAVIGLIVSRTARTFEAPVMTLIALSQFFLLSMIAGIWIGPLHIGSSPFMMLAEKFPEAPIFRQQPGFVPADGNGLNDLLQNPWMVIHPPTLFIGFATLLVPFAYAVAAVWKRRYTEWVRPALPWALFAVMVLGFGIALGGYWAYVTLSFGGYWAWDPVENSSLVPWLTGVAAVHTMITYKKSGASLKAALLLSIVSYLLVIYSTFLTRSGILGDISVHSFVDLGLYGQLVLWMLALSGVGFGLLVYRRRELPTRRSETHLLSREFLIFSGAMLLCAVAAVVLLGTSAPILGKFFRDTPSAVPIAFYNKWTLPLTVGFVFLAGLGQLFWWHNMNVQSINRVVLPPMALAVVSTLAVIMLTPFVERTTVPYETAAPTASAAGLGSGLIGFFGSYGTGLLMLFLLFAAFFALFGNGLVLWRIARGNLKLAGGAAAHVGMVISVLGIITSAGFSNALDGADTPAQGTRGTFVVNRGETRTVEGYSVTYSSAEKSPDNRTSYVLDIVDPAGRSFTLKPVVYRNDQGQWIQHPDVKLFMEKDIYAAVSPNEMFETDTQGFEHRLTLTRDSTARLGENAYTVRFTGFETEVDTDPLPSDSVEIAVAAVMEITDSRTNEVRVIRPVYVIMSDRSIRPIPASVPEWNMSFAFTGMNVNTGRIEVAVDGIEATPEDWLVVQAYEKPFISLLWIGILLLTAGFGLSVVRRVQEYRASPGPA